MRPPTICKCGGAKDYHRPQDNRDHEYEPRFDPAAWTEGYNAAHTGPRPDSGIDALREAAYYAVETWVMYDVDEERMAALEKALGRSVGLENASLNDVRAALDARLATPRTETSELREAARLMAEYLDHRVGCPAKGPGKSPDDCTCGLEVILSMPLATPRTETSE